MNVMVPDAQRWEPERNPHRVCVRFVSRIYAIPYFGMLMGRTMLGDMVMNYVVQFDDLGQRRVLPCELVTLPPEVLAAGRDNIIPFPRRHRASSPQPIPPGAA